ncbi:peptidoglycan -binding protein [Acuticoccus sp. I52.16.1]|uniref:peptidoglycan -binding protein n=1 Tax=Acuticoccus sp. I52.16.1 TaxID=2928472 RepID=UPI001FD4B890|nr:peptidoglycan -binding protein [Acuticoccus sp. I52.16.1]UOM33744.1 peptidoglycan -binding protein [Acuticoccus sp. I52.16.1]
MPLVQRRREVRADYWPGFVDAMATLLLVIIFLLSLFMLSQFFLSQELSGRETALQRLNAQIAELSDLLALERAGNTEQADEVSAMTASLNALKQQRNQLQGIIAGGDEADAAATAETAALRRQLEEEQALGADALSRVALLNQQLRGLRQQIAALEEALEASESKGEESQTRLADLGRRLNVALAERVQILNRFRSDFFGRLREILAERSGIEIVGDRFVFQSEVLFPSGSDALNDAGRQEMATLARELIDLDSEIPDDIDWVLRVDGHTDSRPISGGRFSSNWDLSAARAISVVQYLIEEGVPPNRLVAAGFGEFNPLVPDDTPDAYERNRRIELKLTER